MGLTVGLLWCLCGWGVLGKLLFVWSLGLLFLFAVGLSLDLFLPGYRGLTGNGDNSVYIIYYTL